MALPVLMKAIERNAATPDGAKGLMGALSGKHDGSILDNLGGLFNGGVDETVKEEGAGILGHILGNKQQGVEQVLSQKSGVDSSAVANILKVAAPLLMGVLGKQKKEQNLGNTEDLTGLIGGLLEGGTGAGTDQNFLEKILDADGDGSVIDDVTGMFLGGDKKAGGLGGVLGGLFGK